MKRKFEVWLIKWVDSAFQGGWLSKEDREDEGIICEIVSVGVKIKEEKGILTLALCIEDGTYGHAFHIPVCAIKGRKKLHTFELEVLW